MFFSIFFYGWARQLVIVKDNHVNKHSSRIFSFFLVLSRCLSSFLASSLFFILFYFFVNSAFKGVVDIVGFKFEAAYANYLISSACLSDWLILCLSVCMYTHISLSVCMYVHLHVSLSVCLSFSPSPSTVSKLLSAFLRDGHYCNCHICQIS